MPNLSALKQHLRKRELELHSDLISYSTVAHLVGFDPVKKFNDAPSFHLKPARIPTSLFKSILKDFQMIYNQYGFPQADRDLHVISRFIAPLFHRIISQFHSMIQVNISESYMEHETASSNLAATRPRLIYHEFRICGGVTVLLIEFGMKLEGPEDHLHSVAQLIIDNYRYEFSNFEENFVAPIHCIISDGSSFRFFFFDGSTTPASLFCCVPNGSKISSVFELAMPNNETSDLQFVIDFRKLCETLNAIFHRGFVLGMHAYQRQSLGRVMDIQEDWSVSIEHASAALSKAVAGARYAELTSTRHRAEDEAQEAACELRLSINHIPATYRGEGCEFRDFDDLDELLAKC